ncbi:hypothetical protein [Peptoniphilus sp. HCN-40583]|uniref:hypothetical protein n=1 Tax=Peptoniphilus sp. HCN-40583 TaxID=3134662 RepID=UPI0030BE50B6
MEKNEFFSNFILRPTGWFPCDILSFYFGAAATPHPAFLWHPLWDHPSAPPPYYFQAMPFNTALAAICRRDGRKNRRLAVLGVVECLNKKENQQIKRSER